MAQVENWRSKNPYIVVVRRHPILDDQWVLELPTGATLTTFDDDGDPVFSLPKQELLAHVALRECGPTDMDFRVLADGGLKIDLGGVARRVERDATAIAPVAPATPCHQYDAPRPGHTVINRDDGGRGDH